MSICRLLDAPSARQRGTSSSRSKHTCAWWTFGLSAAAVLGTAYVVHPTGFVGEFTYLSITGGAAVVAIVGVSLQTGSSRFVWRCVALTLTLSTIGDAIYRLTGLVEGSLLDVSVADVFWLASYISLVVGLSSWSVGGSGWRRVDIDALTEIASFAIVAIVITTQFAAIRDMLGGASSSMFTSITYTAYPVLGAAALGLIVQAMLNRKLRNINGLLVSCGVALWLTSDLVSLITDGSTAISTWLDSGWLLGAIGLAASTWPRDTRAERHTEAHPHIEVTDARIVATLVPLLIPDAIQVWEYNRGHDPNPTVLFVATAILVGLVFIRSARLVRARNSRQAALDRSRHFYAALAENSSDAVMVVDRVGRILNDAPNLASMLGRPGVSTIGMDAIQLLHPFDRGAARGSLERWWSTLGVVAEAELRATNFDGSDRWLGIRAANLSNDPVVGGMVINMRDITDRKRAEEELSHKVFHDSLTGLANRAVFHDRLKHALERTSRSGLEVAVVYLDLDDFKTINDSRGHEAGDQVLREMAARLLGTIRSIDTVSRLGGDEFAILVEESARALDEAQAVGDRVLELLTDPFVVHNQQVVLSASIGITVGDVASDASGMMRDADLAMYKAKTSGRARWAVYEPAMSVAALERLELESDLRRALQRNQFRILYQPIVELKSNRVAGFEALLRWDHPRLGVVGPSTFIPIAENNGTIVEIGQWVLEGACRTAAEWRRAHPDLEQTMAVNLSARQLATSEIVGQVAKALAQSGLPASSLVLEITEGVLVQDADIAAQRLEQLRSLGVRLAIDDFGTGYSSLSYLRQFPIDVLKIDRSFTQTITDASPMPAIVRGLLDLAKTLGLETVAEGIELEAQRDSLRDANCDFGQGLLFAEPLGFTEATALLAVLRTVGSGSHLDGLRRSASHRMAEKLLG